MNTYILYTILNVKDIVYPNITKYTYTENGTLSAMIQYQIRSISRNHYRLMNNIKYLIPDHIRKKFKNDI